MANFGTLGDLNSYRGSTLPTGLPQWLLNQMSANTTVDEGGGQRTEYSFNQNPYGGFQRDGRNYVQVGQNRLKDPNAVLHDPELGDYTEVGNVNDITPNGPNYWMLAAVASAGLLGGAAGLGAAATDGAGAAGAGALAGDESAGLLGTGSYAGGGAAGGAGSLAGDESAGLLGTGSYSAPNAGLLAGDESAGLNMANANGVPVSDLSTQAVQHPWYQGAMNSAMNNPLGAARTLAGLYTMATANNQHPGSTGSSGAPGGMLADASGMRQFNPLQAMGQFRQNPYLMQQMMNVPFMGGR